MDTFRAIPVADADRLQAGHLPAAELGDLVPTMLKVAEVYAERGDREWSGVREGETVDQLALLGRKTQTLNGEPLHLGHIQPREEHLKGVTRHVMGAAVDVPTFLAGEPKCMFALLEPPTPTAKVAIVVGVSNHCGIKASELDAYGAAVAGTVAEALRSGSQVEIWSLKTVELYTGNYHMGLVKIADTTQSVSIHKLGFAVASAAALRIIQFALMAEALADGNFPKLLSDHPGLGIPTKIRNLKESTLGKILTEAVFKATDSDRMIYLPTLTGLGRNDFKRKGRDLMTQKSETIDRPTR